MNPNQAADGNLDSDGDTMSNQAEYIAGTDPKDVRSYLKMERIEGTVAGVNLDFLARSNRTYSIYYRPVLNQSSWQVLTNLPARSSNRTERIFDPTPSASDRYYRIGTPGINGP
jgi:hypothetical protein